MRFLVDTHVLLWWLADDPALPASARRRIEAPDNSVVVSAASAWEIAIKYQLGKLPEAASLLSDFGGYLDNERFDPLPMSLDHAVRAGLLPGPHKDPFDRMLIAQAQAEGLALMSNDVVFDGYKIARLW
jgi:PIN domain nuclease of toxin-antitoxin system